MIGFWISFVTGVVLFSYSTYALYVFTRVRKLATTEKSKNFGKGLVLMAFSLGANTLYWQVFGQPALAYDIISLEVLRSIGFYLDLIFKGSGILGIIYAIKGLKS